MAIPSQNAPAAVTPEMQAQAAANIAVASGKPPLVEQTAAPVAPAPVEQPKPKGHALDRIKPPSYEEEYGVPLKTAETSPGTDGAGKPAEPKPESKERTEPQADELSGLRDTVLAAARARGIPDEIVAALGTDATALRTLLVNLATGVGGKADGKPGLEGKPDQSEKLPEYLAESEELLKEIEAESPTIAKAVRALNERMVKMFRDTKGAFNEVREKAIDPLQASIAQMQSSQNNQWADDRFAEVTEAHPWAKEVFGEGTLDDFREQGQLQSPQMKARQELYKVLDGLTEEKAKRLHQPVHRTPVTKAMFNQAFRAVYGDRIEREAVQAREKEIAGQAQERTNVFTMRPSGQVQAEPAPAAKAELSVARYLASIGVQPMFESAAPKLGRGGNGR